MKKVWVVLVPLLALATALQGENGDPVGTTVDVVNQIGTSQNQSTSTTSIAEGGSSWNDNASTSSSQVNISSTSDYEQKTAPLTTFPPYLPYWTHGGWGTIKAYFPNGPTANDQVYETTFDPNDSRDMHEVRSVLHALPHRGVLEAAGSVLNTVAVVLFGKPDTYFHGRGIEIADSIVRDRRPEGKSLLVFIDSNVDMRLLGEEGYAYMGKVSIEADTDRNWDQAYKAAVAEALLWDVDILLISGGMKGVTTGTNVSFPSAAAGYSQVNYSLSLMGSKATGITEGKGKAILSAEAYRYSPQMLERRRIPAALYERIRVRSLPGPASEAVPAPVSEPVSAESERRVVAAIVASAPAAAPPASARRVASAVNPARVRTAAPSQRITPTRSSYHGPGVTMSQELLDLAGFPEDQQIGFVQVR